MSDVPIAPLSDEPLEPPRRSRRGLVVVALIAVAGIVAAAVAVTRSDDHPAPKTVSVAEIEHATRGTVRFHLVASARGFGAPFTITADGVADLDHKASTMTLTTPSEPGAKPTHQTELVVGGTIYIDAASMRTNILTANGESPNDPLSKALRSSKIKWVEIGDFSKGLGRGGPAPFGTNPDPSNVVHSLEAHGVHVSEVGMTTIDGVVATHYRATTTRRVPTPHQESSSNSFTLSQNTLATTTTANASAPAQTMHDVIDLWTDASHRLLRMTSTDTPSGSKDSSTLTETFSDYGGPAPIHAPPRDEVFNFNPVTDLSPPSTIQIGGSSPGTAPAPPPLPHPPATLTGDWSLVASGTSPIPWKVWHGSAAGGWQCFAAEPASVDYNETQDGALISGKRAWCVTDAETTVLHSDVELFTMPLGSPPEFMGLARNGAHSLTVHLTDGPSVDIPVRSDGSFGWYGGGLATSLTWIDAHGTTQKCAPVALGAGEKANMPEPLLPWSCVVTVFIPSAAPMPGVTTIP